MEISYVMAPAKARIFLALLLAFPTLVGAQILQESFSESAFNASQFGGRYSFKILNQLIEQDPLLISEDVSRLQVRAVDLTDPGNTSYERIHELDAAFRLEYLVSDEEMRARSKSLVGLPRVWREFLIENDLMKDVLEPMSRGGVLTLRSNAVVISNASSNESWKSYIHKFEFDGENRLVFQGYGYTTASRDTLLWKQSFWEYGNHALNSHIQKVFSVRGGQLALKELEEKTFENHKINERNLMYFNSKDVAFKTQSVHYTYGDGGLEKTDLVTETLNVETNQIEPVSHTVTTFSKGKPMVEMSSSPTSQGRRVYTYDSLGRLVSSTYQVENLDGEVIERSREEVSYSTNTYVFTYREELKIHRGMERMPLEFQVRFTFMED